MKIIGLTGGIGSGKSTVAGFLQELGAVCIDLDNVGHQVMAKGLPVYETLVKEFGERIVGDNGDIDREVLGNVVFQDMDALSRLNSIVHPAIDEVVIRTGEEARRHEAPVLVLEAAAMLENQREWQTDEIWVTIAPENTVLERLSHRSGYTEEQSLARIRAQMTNEERRSHADVVIDTDCTLDELRSRVGMEWKRLLARL